MTRFSDILRHSIRCDRCIYCGERQESDEHFPPASIDGHGYIFSACIECNCFACDEYPFSLKNRFIYVKSKLRAKYKKALTCPEWTSEELEDLDGRLRDHVSKAAEARRIIQNRLDWTLDDYFDASGVRNPFAYLTLEGFMLQFRDEMSLSKSESRSEPS